MYKGLSDTFDRYDMLKKAKEEQDRLEKLRLESIRQFDLGEARANTAEGRLQAANNEAIRQFGVNSDRLRDAEVQKNLQYDNDYLLKTREQDRADATANLAATAAEDTSFMSAAQLEAIKRKNADNTPMEGLNGNFGDRIMGEGSDTTKAVKEYEALIGQKASVAEVREIAKEIRTAKTAQAAIQARGLNTPRAQSVAMIEEMDIPEDEKLARIKAILSNDRRFIRTAPSTPSQFKVERK